MSYQPPPPSDPHFYGPQSPQSPPAPPPHYPPPHPAHYPAPQYMHTTTGTDSSKKFLNMTGGVLAGVIAGVLLLCCVGPVALCFLGGFVDGLQPKPDVTITSCKVDDSGFFQGADIDYRIQNNRSTQASYTVEFVVRDASGTQVGEGSDYVSDLAGGSAANRSTSVSLDAKGGQTCHVVSVD